VQEQLEGMRAQLGISKERAEAIQRETKAQELGVSAANLEGEGFTLTKVLELADAGIDVGKAASETIRNSIFRRELERRLCDGTGNFDAADTLEALPTKMKLDRKFVTKALKEIVGSRRRMLLVQAISQLRQKRPQDALTSTHNLVSCWKAMPDSGPMPWTERAELQDVYVAYATRVSRCSPAHQLADACVTMRSLLAVHLAAGCSLCRSVSCHRGTGPTTSLYPAAICPWPRSCSCYYCRVPARAVAAAAATAAAAAAGLSVPGPAGTASM
jgi:hypothetical protein